jgi:hypothetical protein
MPVCYCIELLHEAVTKPRLASNMSTPPPASVPSAKAISAAEAAGQTPAKSPGLALATLSPRGYLPAAAGVAYLAAWAAGLAVWPVNLALNATAAQVAASYRAHPAEAVAQYLLTEGLAGILLGVVLACVLLPQVGDRVTARTTGAALLGAIAVAISLAQCVIGLLLTAAATSHDTARCGDLSALVTRLDGVKMIAIAGAAAMIAAARTPGPLVSGWLRVVTVPLALALIASGYAYLTLTNPLAWTAFISGLLLLLWVTGAGVATTIRHRRGSEG